MAQRYITVNVGL